MTFEESIKKIAVHIGQIKALKLWRQYQLSDGIGKRELESLIELQLQQKYGEDPLRDENGLQVPPEQDAAGPYELGNVLSYDRIMHPFGIREDEFIQHMAIFGRSGAGKTNTVALLIKELVRHKKPFLIFDWKRNYRDLLAHGVPLEVYTVGRPAHPLHFNPLIPPPGTDMKVWLKKLIEIISHAYFLGEGVMFILLEAIDAVYSKFGCYTNEPERYPTLQDVLEFLEKMPVKGRKAMWLDSTMRAVQSLCFGQISDVINTNSQTGIQELLDKNICLELNSLAQNEKTFLIETIMVWIHHCRMLEPDRETFKHCIIIEEAHNILSNAAKETVIDLLMREIRELGESIVLVDQHPSQISVPALGNTYCTIALNMKHSKDINSLAEMMRIPKENRETLGLLPIGHAVVKLQSRFIHPFEIQIPKVDLNKGSVTDTTLSQIYVPHSTDSAPEPDDTAGSDQTEVVPENHRIEKHSTGTGLSETEEILLKDIHKHPFDGVVKRYSRMGISRRRGNHAKQNLTEKGIIHSVDIPTRTGKVVLLDLTPIMREAMKRNGIDVPKRKEGGLVHNYWKNEIRKQLEKDGWAVELEKPMGNNMAIDLYAEKDGKRIAVEVETGTRGAENIKKLIPLNLDHIISFSTTHEVKLKTLRDFGAGTIHVNNLNVMDPSSWDRLDEYFK
ncbi:hypothetical protein PDESU_03644 [Pontiella desulfatans]|uniref:Helicase HerA central domain-containing protein n=1 Tax=Pontiella desulfatans TaxID=2750659 RepID=A0A6C2U6L5_PONDE|nr:DUF87 domain-containing protein [Pontiella desulfatans]VGO15064.1 hypothetical protein PDESU_03644 [Pontiella desulfatans]